MKIKEFFDSQLAEWPLALENYKAVQNAERKEITVGDLSGSVLLIPSRSRSTLAKLTPGELLESNCFLCNSNRPFQQNSFEIIPGWDLLVNPYPILPFHFTIASKSHIPQSPDMEMGLQLADILDDMVVFFNGAGAGASAPHHKHFQAVGKHELPLISLIDGISDDKVHDLNLPFSIIMDKEEIKNLKETANIFYWKNKETGKLCALAIPRKSHRPSHFFEAPPKRRAFSPGAIDMAGVLVTPYKEDFDAVTSDDIREIYEQVAFLK